MNSRFFKLSKLDFSEFRSSDIKKILKLILKTKTVNLNENHYSRLIIKNVDPNNPEKLVMCLTLKFGSPKFCDQKNINHDPKTGQDLFN